MELGIAGKSAHIGSATAKGPVGLIHHAIADATRPSTIGLLKTAADEYAKYGITINTVAPGWILTDNVVEYPSKDETGGREQRPRHVPPTGSSVGISIAG